MEYDYEFVATMRINVPSVQISTSIKEVVDGKNMESFVQVEHQRLLSTFYNFNNSSVFFCSLLKRILNFLVTIHMRK